MLHPNEIAFRAGKAIFEAAQPIEVDVEGTKVTVVVSGKRAWNRPRLPNNRPLPGLADLPESAWPASLELHATWQREKQRGSVHLGLRLTVLGQPGPYEGHIAIQIVTLPSNRDVVWINLMKRIEVARAAKAKKCPIPANFSLWARTGERSARPLTDSLTQAARNAGLTTLPAMQTQFLMFEVILPGGEITPAPRDVFERLVKAALLKVPYVTRDEAGADVEGISLFDISVAQREAAETAEAATPVEAIPAAEPTIATSQPNAVFSYVGLSDFGPIKAFDWEEMARINVIVGENDTGKSHLLKAMYALASSIEEFTARSVAESDQPTWAKVIEEKIVWTFEPLDRSFERLIRRGANPLRSIVDCTLGNENYSFFLNAAGSDKPLRAKEDAQKQPDLHAMFIPPKEVLTSLHAIAAVRDKLKIFGFDDTYVDLARALQRELVQVVLPDEFQRVLDELDHLLDGRIEVEQGRFFFVRKDEKYSMSQTAEGIKKIGIISRLIRNSELRRNSILFLDEPEVNLHPKAARALVKMLFDLSRAGVQIFAATHSYFVLKEFEILARDRDEKVMLCSLSRMDGEISAEFSDLRHGLPETAIRRESLAQYDEDIEVSWKKRAS